MAVTATLRQSGGSIILSIPRAIASSLDVQAGSVVELTVEGQSLKVERARRTLADRLAASPRSPKAWARDDEWLSDATAGRELV